jgi:hypothetical protein
VGVVNLLISLYRLCPVWHIRSMKTAMPANSYKNHRFPAEIISHAVWLYFRFCLGSALHVMLAKRCRATVDQKRFVRERRSTASDGHQRGVSTVSVIQI